MIKRLYVNNYKCLVAFDAAFDSFGVLCGPNGAGKSSVFDALQLIRNLATGDALLGGEGKGDIPNLEFTNWLNSTTQEFELSVATEGRTFEYRVHIEQKADFEKPRVVKEQATCDGKSLFTRDLDGVHFQKSEGNQAEFPLDWRRAALAAIQPHGSLRELSMLQEEIAKVLILRPDPRAMKPESKSEMKHPDLSLSNLISWYRSLSQDLDWAVALRDLLQGIWPDFRSLKLVDAGLNTKALQLRFEQRSTNENGLFFEQLSDGEKALVGLYMIRAAIATGAARTVLIDEPDNYVGLPELQPWALSLRELLDEEHQAIIISHHPEILGQAGEDCGRYLWRDNHASSTRITPLKVPEGITAGEAIARGWINA
ncbi:MAG: AAA family ATPase [Verrucomicrobiota bacterium]